VLLVAMACQSRDDLDGRRPKVATATSNPSASAGEGDVAVSLIDNRGPALMIGGGRLTVSAKAARIVPYIDGNVRREWQLSTKIDGRVGAAVRGRIANLFVPLDRDPGGVLAGSSETVTLAFSLRPAKAHQVASLFVNEKAVADVRFADPVWQMRAVKVPASHFRIGENRVRLFFRHLGESGPLKGSPAVLGSMTIGGETPVETPSVEHGDGNRTLVCSAKCRMSFYVALPTAERKPRLRLRVRSEGTAAIDVALASGRHRSLWSAQKKGAGDVDVSLQELAGDVVRLDLRSDGPVRWLEPAVVVDRREPPEVTTRQPVDRIIVWAISSLRADRIGERTSQLAAFQRTSAAFHSAWSPAPVADLAHRAVLGGGPAEMAGSSRRVAAVAEGLRDRGYATALISGNGFINDAAGFDRGFDTYVNPMRLRRPHSARVLWQSARRFLLQRRDRKAFVYLATVEPHLPYTPDAASLEAEWGVRPQPLVPAKTATVSRATEEGRLVIAGAEREFVTALYNAEVRDADAAFGAMLRDLRELDLPGTTAILVFGDHGESLFEDGSFGHSRGLGDELLRVPLMVQAPNLQPGARTHAVTLGDVSATLLELGGAQGQRSRGDSLLNEPTHSAGRALVFRNRQRDWGIRHGDIKLLVPAQGPAVLMAEGRLVADGEMPVATRFLRAALSYAVAFDVVWDDARWGHFANHRAAFASDQGL